MTDKRRLLATVAEAAEERRLHIGRLLDAVGSAADQRRLDTGADDRRRLKDAKHAAWAVGATRTQIDEAAHRPASGAAADPDRPRYQPVNADDTLSRLLYTVAEAAEARRRQIRSALDAVSAAADRRRRNRAAVNERFDDAMRAAEEAGATRRQIADAAGLTPMVVSVRLGARYQTRPGPGCGADAAPLLAAVTAAAVGRRDRAANQRLDEAMRTADDAGVPRTEIAAAAGLDRSSPGRRLGPRGPRPDNPSHARQRRRLLTAVETAADTRRRNSEADDQRLDDAMRTADDAGITRTEIAAAAGLARTGPGRRLGPRGPRPDSPSHARRRQLLRAVKTAGDTRRRHRAGDDQRLNDAMRAADAAGVARQGIAAAAGLGNSVVSCRLGVRRPPRPFTAHDRRLDAAMSAAASAGVARREIAAAAAMPPKVVADRLSRPPVPPEPQQPPGTDSGAGQEPEALEASIAVSALPSRTTVHDNKLFDAMRAAEAGGAYRVEIADAVGMLPSVVRRRLGPRQRPVEAPAPVRRKAFRAVVAAAKHRLRRRDADEQRLDDAMRAAAAGGVSQHKIAAAAGMNRSTVYNRIGATRRHRTRET